MLVTAFSSDMIFTAYYFYCLILNAEGTTFVMMMMGISRVPDAHINAMHVSMYQTSFCPPSHPPHQKVGEWSTVVEGKKLEPTQQCWW